MRGAIALKLIWLLAGAAYVGTDTLDANHLGSASGQVVGVRYRCRGVWLMATKHMPIDYAERDLASAQLDELALPVSSYAQLPQV